MRRKLFPVTMLAIAVLLALGRCAPTVATPTPRPPTLAPTPAAEQVELDDDTAALIFHGSLIVLEVGA